VCATRARKARRRERRQPFAEGGSAARERKAAGGVRRHRAIEAPAIGCTGDVIAYGHWGRPVLAFPSEQGPCWQYEERGMVDAIGPLLDAGRVKLYCVDSFDAGSWQRHDLPLEERARLHGAYEDWIVNGVVPWIREDSGGGAEIAVTGVSFGAYHAANFALRRADLFPLAICQSGVYDVSVAGWGERGDAVYFNNPVDYVANMNGDHLAWLRRRLSILLLVGRGQWEDTTGALESTHRFAALLAEKGIRHELDVWGPEFPHDWPSWRAQIAHHLPRFA
jgi:esterase/lipase superfamily enzyme